MLPGYWVYVFELADDVGSLRNVPAKQGRRPYVYVGYTGKPRRQRLREHRIGWHFADRKWVPYYVRARPDLYRGWGPYLTPTEALRMERTRAESLKTHGYTVANNTGRQIQIPSSAE